MKRVLIIGASGLIGNYLYHRAIALKSKTLGTFHEHPLDGLIHLDITDKNAIKKNISEFNPDSVFLPAAFTNVDLGEEKKEICWQINVEGVRNLVSFLKGTGLKLTYFSTDYIFNGENGPYNEDSQPEPLSVYGKSKLEGEKIIENNLNNFLIIRTTCVYGWESQEKNFVFNLIKRINNQEAVKIPADQVTTPTYVRDLSEISLKLTREDKRGIYNVAGGSRLSRYEFALLVAQVFALDKNLICAVKTGDLSGKARRPLNAGLKIDKIKRELGLDIPGANEGLLQMKRESEHGFFK